MSRKIFSPSSFVTRRRVWIALGVGGGLLALTSSFRRALQSWLPTADIDLHATARPVATLDITDELGQALTLASFRGRVVLLNIWATWCPPCREEMPTLDHLQGMLGGPDFEVLALSIDRAGLSAVRPFFDRIGVKYLRPYLDTGGGGGLANIRRCRRTANAVNRQGRQGSRAQVGARRLG